MEKRKCDKEIYKKVIKNFLSSFKRMSRFGILVKDFLNFMILFKPESIFFSG